MRDRFWNHDPLKPLGYFYTVKYSISYWWAGRVIFVIATADLRSYFQHPATHLRCKDISIISCLFTIKLSISTPECSLVWILLKILTDNIKFEGVFNALSRQCVVVGLAFQLHAVVFGLWRKVYSAAHPRFVLCFYYLLKQFRKKIYWYTFCKVQIPIS